MRYLFIDLECSNGKNICEFGYVLVNENFKVLDKNIFIMNPEAEFKLAGRGQIPNIVLAYDYDYYKTQPNFTHFYEKIKQLLTHENQVVLGHSVNSDIGFINIACQRYGLEKIEFKAFDIQKIYSKYTEVESAVSLEKILDVLKIKAKNLVLHRSQDDAFASMLVAKQICKKHRIKISKLINDNSFCFVDGISVPKIQTFKLLNHVVPILEKEHNTKIAYKNICLSDSVYIKDKIQLLAFINIVLKNKYNFTRKVGEADYYVIGSTPGKRDEYVNYYKQQGKKIKIINLYQLGKMLKLNVHKNIEIKEFVSLIVNQKQYENFKNRIHNIEKQLNNFPTL